MNWYPSPAGEARATRIAARRAGCTVRELAVHQTSDGPHVVGRVECPDGWAAARMLLAAAIEDSKTPGARDVALRLRQTTGSDEEYARALQAYVREHVAFVRESGEVFQNGGYTLAVGAGDCDDHARAVYALAAAGGLPAVMAYLHDGGPPTHAVAQLCPDGQCAWAETTVDAEYGEHPIAAAERHGLIDARQDISRQVRVMSENELPSLPMVPSGYLAANPIEQVERDASALYRLGYLYSEDSAAVGSAADPSFRTAVQRFQNASGGLVVDGLIGPKTRARIAQALPQDEFGMGYLAAVAPVTPKLTAAWTDEDFATLRRIASELQVSPEWLVLIMISESGMRPSAANRSGGNLATGLIQWMNLDKLGIMPDNSRASHDEFATWPVSRQLPHVKRYFAPIAGRAKMAGNLYQYTFVPASLARGTDDDTIIAASNGTGYNGQEARFYAANKSLDYDKNGAITVGDLERHLAQLRSRAIYTEAMARLGMSSSASAGASVVGKVLAGILIPLSFGALAHAVAAWR